MESSNSPDRPDRFEVVGVPQAMLLGSLAGDIL